MPEGWVVRQEASLQLPDSVPEPDLCITQGTEAEFFVRHPTTAALVVEVAVTSLAFDREKAAIYAEADQDQRVYRRGDLIENVAVLGEAALAVETLFA